MASAPTTPSWARRGIGMATILFSRITRRVRPHSSADERYSRRGAVQPRMAMPRLAQEGVVGADAIFACIGPALEMFSRH